MTLSIPTGVDSVVLLEIRMIKQKSEAVLTCIKTGKDSCGFKTAEFSVQDGTETKKFHGYETPHSGWKTHMGTSRYWAWRFPNELEEKMANMEEGDTIFVTLSAVQWDERYGRELCKPVR